ncbi:transglycosylase family protein [Actinomycetospora atypica]|uniref:Transglycosylase family protein n=1 Tax=Actinomycetospora atypica TaxID=1290095 RepID=A0ABV9YMJ1_9PSEU
MPKHRAPAASRLRSTLVATTTGPLALAALGTLAAPAAQAAPSGSVNWDAVAQCESSGDWSANTGNGFSGGLQFTRSTWKAFGGSGDAKDASREQQIAVAERVLDGQGIGAWPVCGKKGLGGGGSSNAASSSGSSEASSSKAPKAPKASKASSKKSDSADSGRHRAPEKASGGYTVAAGDTLGSIADAHQVRGGWQALASANRDVATDPNMIFPGQQLNLPA